MRLAVSSFVGHRLCRCWVQSPCVVAYLAVVCGGIDCMELFSFYELCGINSMVDGDSHLWEDVHGIRIMSIFLKNNGSV